MYERTRESDRRWNAWPFGAGLVRAVALLLPIGASVAFVYLASRSVPPPSGSLALYLGWWLGLSVTATLTLVVVGRLSRRLLPLAALMKLSLVFPDATPSRFRTAIAWGTVKTLEERLVEARRGDPEVTPAVAAQRLLTLVAALDAHDSLTRGHSERVRAYSQMIGRELGLGPGEAELLNWAALLHDIGKLEIPSEILNRKGRPSDDEWATIRGHPTLGETLVAPLREWLGVWSDAVGDHHEHWDGAGYPRGIAGTDISLAGRIVAVADVFDVITSTRSYKQASTMAAARAEIARCAGTRFDPEVVRAFLALSLGRARIATGPLSWLAQAAVLARTPLTAAAGTLSAAAVVGGISVAPGGIIEPGARIGGATVAPSTFPVTLKAEPPVRRAPLSGLADNGTTKPPRIRASTTPAPAGDRRGTPTSQPEVEQPAAPTQTSQPPATSLPNAPAAPPSSSEPEGTSPPAPLPTPPLSRPPTLPKERASPPLPPAPPLLTPPTLPKELALPSVPPPPLTPPTLPKEPLLPSVPPLPSALPLPLPTPPSLPSAPAVPPTPPPPSAPSLPSVPSAPSLPTPPALP